MIKNGFSKSWFVRQATMSPFTPSVEVMRLWLNWEVIMENLVMPIYLTPTISSLNIGCVVHCYNWGIELSIFNFYILFENDSIREQGIS